MVRGDASSSPIYFSQRRDAYVATVLQSNPLNIQFRRTLAGNRWEAWLHLVRRLMDVHLSQQPDQLRWKLTRNGVFSVKSMYVDIINSGIIPRSLHIWKVKVPLKIKVFMWFVHKQVILTKDNLANRNWNREDVVSAIMMSLSNTSFSIAQWQKCYGGLCT